MDKLSIKIFFILCWTVSNSSGTFNQKQNQFVPNLTFISCRTDFVHLMKVYEDWAVFKLNSNRVDIQIIEDLG